MFNFVVEVFGISGNGNFCMNSANLIILLSEKCKCTDGHLASIFSFGNFLYFGFIDKNNVFSVLTGYNK